MADWYGKWRTNEFEVKDIGKFRKFIEIFEGQVEMKIIDEKTNRVIALEGKQSQFGELPRFYKGENYEEPVDFLDELPKYVAKGSYAVVVEIGSEKYFQLTGFVAILADNKVLLSKDLYSVVGEYAAEHNLKIDMSGL
jgi:hypothetical protein